MNYLGGDKMKKLYSVVEAAQILSTSKDVVYSLIRKGIIKPIKIGSFKIPLAEIDNFIDKYTGYDISDLDAPKML